MVTDPGEVSAKLHDLVGKGEHESAEPLRISIFALGPLVSAGSYFLDAKPDCTTVLASYLADFTVILSAIFL